MEEEAEKGKKKGGREGEGGFCRGFIGRLWTAAAPAICRTNGVPESCLFTTNNNYTKCVETALALNICMIITPGEFITHGIFSLGYTLYINYGNIVIIKNFELSASRNKLCVILRALYL